jgi:hypothetical protein
MIKIRKILLDYLKSVHSRVYYEVAPETATLPYVVFDLPNSVNFEADRQDFTLEIDVWDNNKDTTGIETLTTNIDKVLHKLRHLDNDYLLIIERNNRLNISDPDLKRRMLRYTVKVYERV